MAGLIFLLAAVAAAGGMLCYEAAQQLFRGTAWAVDVCSRADLFCKHPEYLGYTAAVLLVAAVVAKLGGALQG
jgi:hypothetical protein